MAQLHQSNPSLLLDKYRRKWSFANGVSRGSDGAAQHHQADLDKAIAQVDGLMAGLQYLDEASPSQLGSSSPRPSYTQFHPATLDMSDTYPFSVHELDLDKHVDWRQSQDSRPSLTSTGSFQSPGQKPIASQWAAIRTLRGETEFHHRRFQEVTEASDNLALSALLKEFPKARDIRKKGTLIFRDVLKGYEPHKLKDIFALASLSYAISQLLLKRKRIKEYDVLSGLRTWRDAISDRGEREAFNLLAQNLWPEAKLHLHFIPLPQIDQTRDSPHLRLSRDDFAMDEIEGFSGDLGLPGHAVGNPTVNDASVPTASVPEFVDAGQPYESLDILEQAFDLIGMASQEFDFSSFNDENMRCLYPANGPGALPPPDPPPVESSPNRLTPEPEPDMPSPHNAGRGSDLPNSGSDATQLRDTIAFIAILVFFKEVGDLLQVLSGRSLAPEPVKPYMSQQDDQKRFVELAQINFFEPRWQAIGCPNPPFSALMSVAEMFTELGYLSSIDQVKYYLIGIAGAVFPHGDLFNKFVTWVMVDEPGTTAPCPPAHENLPHTDGHRKRSTTVDKNIPTSDGQPSNKRRCLYGCNIGGCNIQCETPAGLSKHKKTVHDGVRSYRCDKCGYSSTRRDRVRDHFRKQHPGLVLPAALQETRRARFAQPT